MVLRKLWFVISKIFCGCQLFRNYNNGIPLHIGGAQPSSPARKISTTITLRKALNSSWLFILSTCITVLNHLMLHIKVKLEHISCSILSVFCIILNYARGFSLPACCQWLLMRILFCFHRRRQCSYHHSHIHRHSPHRRNCLKHKRNHPSSCEDFWRIIWLLSCGARCHQAFDILPSTTPAHYLKPGLKKFDGILYDQ